MPHHLALHKMSAEFKNEMGYRYRAVKKDFPVLEGMSFNKLVIQPGAFREPHWHPNADELGYCLKGSVIVTLYASRNQKESFLVSEGEVYLIPSGAFHSLENVGSGVAEILAQFSHEDPEDFELSAVFTGFSNSVLGNTWDVSSDHFKDLKKNTRGVIFGSTGKPSSIPKDSKYASLYRFRLQESFPIFHKEGGKAKAARQNVWPILERQAVYSLLISETGMREPHWHPKTAELGYLVEGRVRMTILSPDGSICTYILEPGDIYFIPKAYPHHIENLSCSDSKMVLFFDQAMPQDIGFTATLKAFPEEIIAGALHCKKEVITSLPTYFENLLIVNKRNPLDP